VSIDAQLIGGEALLAKVQAIQDRVANLQPALLRAGIVVLKAAADRIDSGGPGWAPNITGTPLLHQTGRLLSSLTIGGPDDIADVSSTSITVGTNVAYAGWLQVGTGIFGPSGQRIKPTTAKALAFNGMMFSSIAGSPARPFLFIDANVAETVRTVFASYVLEGSVS
jgi:phage gpG-like protein